MNFESAIREVTSHHTLTTAQRNDLRNTLTSYGGAVIKCYAHGAVQILAPTNSADKGRITLWRPPLEIEVR